MTIETDFVDETQETLFDHVRAHDEAVASLWREVPELASWGRTLAERLLGGGRLLAMGNGGSAAEAQHLTAEIVGRFDGERIPLSAIALHADTSSVTAIANDYGYDEVFARQVRAHARPGDIVLALSTSGSSANLLHGVEAASECGAESWAITGPAPNPLQRAVDVAIALQGTAPAVQEAQLIAVHMLCRAFDAAVRGAAPPRPISVARRRRTR